jgi:hypothetical protein
MIELIPIESQKVVGIRINGKIEKADMEKITRDIDEKLKSQEKLRIYVELESFGGISFEAFIEDIKLGFSHLREFEKKAVVSDKAWVARLADWGGQLIPSMEVKHFTFEEREKALDWVQA